MAGRIRGVPRTSASSPADSDKTALIPDSVTPPASYNSTDATLVLRAFDLLQDPSILLRSQAHLIALTNSEVVLYSKTTRYLTMMYIKHASGGFKTCKIELFSIEANEEGVVSENTDFIRNFKKRLYEGYRDFKVSLSYIKYLVGATELGSILHRYDTVPMCVLGHLLCSEAIAELSIGAPAAYIVATREDKILDKVFGEYYRLDPRSGSIIFPALGIRDPLPSPALLWSIYSFSASLQRIPPKTLQKITDTGEPPAKRYALKTLDDLEQQLNAIDLKERAKTEDFQRQVKSKMDRGMSHADAIADVKKEEEDAERKVYTSKLSPWKKYVLNSFVGHRTQPTPAKAADPDSVSIVLKGIGQPTVSSAASLLPAPYWVAAGGRKVARA